MRGAVLDPAAFLALSERCLPGADPKPLAAIVARASGREPLAIRFDDGPGGPMKLIGSSRPEAVQLASELVIAGHRVRVGLAGLDTRDLDRLGLTLGQAFEPCAHLRAAARLLAEAPERLETPRSHTTSAPAPDARAATTIRAAPAPDARPARAWDVYGQGRSSAAKIYGSAGR